MNLSGPVMIDYPKTNGTYLSGGAGLSSTVYDYAIFLQMLLNGGEYDGKRILSGNAVRMMTMNQIGDLRLGDDVFGLGFNITTEKGSGKMSANTGTFEWGGAFSTTYWVDPKEKIVALFYKQLWQDPAPEAASKFRVILYGAITD